jgi:DME family drug/metabolite transporter
MPRLLVLLAGVRFGTTGTAQALGPDSAPPTGATRVAIGGLLLAPVLIAGALSWLRGGDGIAMALFLGAIPTALAYVLFARGLRLLKPGETATPTLADPLTATGLGIVAPGERPGALAGAGAALVLAGPLARALPSGRRAPRLASVAA